MAIYAVGDIQGCYKQLSRLLDKVNFDQSKDTLLCVGDLVNRGPNSLKVIRLIKSLEKQCITVIGNHDIHLLSLVYGIRNHRQTDTLKKVLRAPDIGEIADWLRKQPLIYINKKHRYVLCHAGIYPWWNLDQASQYAKEMSILFKNKKAFAKMLKKTYGNTPYKWDNSLGAIQRRRFIINSFTRMRFVSYKKRLNLTERGYKGKFRKNRVPWFHIENPDFKNYRIIFGHWSALGLLNTPNYLCLDTGCVWGKKLTLAKIPKKPKRLKAIKKSQIISVKGYK